MTAVQDAVRAGGLACPDYLLKHAVPSPCFVIDEDALKANAAILDDVQKRTGARILLALKAYSAWKTFPLLSRCQNGPLWGTCASSVDEARLGREKFGGIVSAFAAAWSEEEIRELLETADHIIFNSTAQWRRYKPLIDEANKTARKDSPVECGLRLNPEHSEGATAIYNPCAPGSRLGIRQKNLDLEALPPQISGAHFHTLCEQNADALSRTLESFEKKFGKQIRGCSWLNFGGGHHITRKDYDVDLLCSCLNDWRDRYQAQIYLEPGEAVALNAGWLVCTVLDIIEADMPVAILDVSAACHMPDVLEMPYRPEVCYLENASALPQKAGQEGENAHSYRLGGKSCLAGDDIGVYSFKSPLQIGQKLAFADMAIYSMVKTTTFNGLRLPSIGLFSTENGKERFELLKTFGYEDFRGRLS